MRDHLPSNDGHGDGMAVVCGILQDIRLDLCFLPLPLGAGHDPNREVRSGVPSRSSMDLERRSFFKVYIAGFSQGELSDLTSVASLREPARETTLLHKVDAWRVPRADKQRTGQRGRG